MGGTQLACVLFLTLGSTPSAQHTLSLTTPDRHLKQQKLQQEAAKDSVDTQLKVAELQLEAEQGRPVAIG